MYEQQGKCVGMKRLNHFVQVRQLVLYIGPQALLY